MIGGILFLLLWGAADGWSKNTLGGLENVEVRAEAPSGVQLNLPYEARIDTGATETCLDAVEIKKFSRGATPYVRFRTRSEGASYELQAPFVKEGRVRSSNGMAQKRVFVRLEVCVGKQRLATVVSLADRHAMRQPVLVGRTLLQGRYVVDVESDHVAGEPDCD